MVSSRWQKQHIHFQKIVWGVAAGIALLGIILMLALGFSIEVAGIFFIADFAIMRIALAFIFKNRFANSMVRVLKFDPEELERDFRIVFKDTSVRFYRHIEEDGYRYEFPGHNLNMTTQPYWVSQDRERPFTKLTLYKLTAQNEPFAEMLAEAIDEMVERRSGEGGGT